MCFSLENFNIQSFLLMTVFFFFSPISFWKPFTRGLIKTPFILKMCVKVVTWPPCPQHKRHHKTSGALEVFFGFSNGTKPFSRPCSKRYTLIKNYFFKNAYKGRNNMNTVQSSCIGFFIFFSWNNRIRRRSFVKLCPISTPTAS